MASNPVIVVTGAGGQLGKTIELAWPHSQATGRYELLSLGSDELDITDPLAVSDRLADIPVAAIVNGAAYTDVDRAEQERDRAFAVNADGAANLARWCHANGSRLIQVSTDFVFAGDSNTPYAPQSPTGPLGVYGASKLAGEQAVLEAMPGDAVVLRTSWLYSPFNSNFVLTMLRLLAEREQLSVVDDQIGSPTSTFSLAQCIDEFLANNDLSGIYHWCDGARISWYQFALEIQARALELGILDRKIPVTAIPTSDYPTPAKRPAYSVLDISATLDGLKLAKPDWHKNLNQVLGHLAQTGSQA